jgi:hypothetical protein
LSAFDDTATLDAVEAVLPDTLRREGLLVAVRGLVDHNLVVPVGRTSGFRVRMLQTVRAYARGSCATPTTNTAACRGCTRAASRRRICGCAWSSFP